MVDEGFDPQEVLTLTHLAGPDAAVEVDADRPELGRHLRQRCVWCGILLVDKHLDGDVGEDDVWLAGEMVRHFLQEAEADWVPVPYDEAADDIPFDSCMLLPLELTGTTGSHVRR
jgi:hypothetical protein